MRDLISAMGRLEMWIGPMYSGKTSMLLDKIAQHSDQVFVITHKCDTRYAIGAVVSHNKRTQLASASCDRLMPLVSKACEFAYVAIEEGQFFEDIGEFVVEMVEKHDKTVYVAGLDGDFRRQPFRNILDLVPFADTVTRLTSKCHLCGCPAPFSKRLALKHDETVLVGGTESYLPACRIHFD